MEKEQKNQKVNWPLRILKWILPFFVLFSGFFGIQVWMMYDDQARIEASKDKENAIESGAKENVERLKSQEAAPAKEGASQNSDQAAVVIELPGIEFYRLQVGSFSELDGAKKMIKQINEMGYAGVTVKEDTQNKVIAMVFFGSDQAHDIKKVLEEKGLGAYPGKVTCPVIKLQVEGGSQRLKEFTDGEFQEIPKMLKSFCDQMYIYENGPYDKKVLDQLALQQSNMLSDMESKLSNMQVDKKDEEIKLKLNELVKNYKSYSLSLKNQNKYDRIMMWTGVMKIILQYQQLKSIQG